LKSYTTARGQGQNLGKEIGANAKEDCVFLSQQKGTGISFLKNKPVSFFKGKRL
jgi:hypothetical protein